jgi:phosphate-selective porin OprO/OprP
MRLTLMALLSSRTAFAQGAPPPAAPPPSQEDRSKVEKQSPTAETTTPPVAPQLNVSFWDGIHFRSGDGDFDVTVGGYAAVHYRVFLDRPADNVRTSPDSFFLRQARPEITGILYRDFDFKIQWDFPSGSYSTTGAAPNSVSGTLQDGWIGWHQFPELSLRLGEFKEPFGQEQTTADRYIDFAERSDIDRLVPGRDIGLELFGVLASGTLTYEAGVFNGQGRAVVDQDEGKEVAGRLRLQPWATRGEGDLLKRFRLGISGTHAIVTQSSSANFILQSTDLVISYLVPNNPAANPPFMEGPRSRYGAEWTWNLGPVGLRAEGFERIDGWRVPPTLSQIPIRTWAGMAQVTWLLTGEVKPIEARLNPAHPFNPRKGDWGALELDGRLDRVRVEKTIFTSGIAPQAGFSNGVTTAVVGAKWYLNRNLSVVPDFIQEHYDEKLRFADGRERSTFYGAIFRVELEF